MASKMMSDDAFLSHVLFDTIPPYPPEATHRRDTFDLESAKQIANDTLLRHRVIKLGMYAIVTRCWTAKLAEWIGNRRVLEVMAGRGWLAKALQDYGVDVIATDNASWSFNEQPPLTHVFRCTGVQAVRRFSGRDVLLMSWPPYGEPTARQIAAAWGTSRPIVFIGEGRSGRTADETFFDHFQIEETWSIPQWPCIHDYLYIGYWRK